MPDVVLVTVRRDQLEDAIPALADLPAGRVVFLLNLPGDLDAVRERVGAHRTVFAFPGVGGRRHADGTIDYVEVPQQKTTVERRGLEAPIVDLLKSAGFPVETTSDMAGWLATHAVFVTAMGAAILACGGDSVALADDPAQLAAMVAAVREGFRALDRNGVTVTPAPLKLLFTVVPRFAAVRYWSKQLRGPLGTVAIAPHVRASRETELPMLCADVRRLVAGAGPLPHLERLLDAVRRRPCPCRRMTPSASTHARRWWILAILCLSVLLVAIDNTIVNVALPTLSRELACVDLRAAVDRRHLHRVLRRAAAGLREHRRPVRAQASPAGRAGAVRPRLPRRRAIGVVDQLDRDPRAIMGLAAALIYPSTLALLSTVFTNRQERATRSASGPACPGLPSRSAPSSAACCSSTSGGARSSWSTSRSWRWPWCRRALPAGVEDPSPGSFDRARRGAVGRRRRPAGLDGHRSAPRGWTDAFTLAGFAAPRCSSSLFVARGRRAGRPAARRHASSATRVSPPPAP